MIRTQGANHKVKHRKHTTPPFPQMPTFDDGWPRVQPLHKQAQIVRTIVCVCVYCTFPVNRFPSGCGYFCVLVPVKDVEKRICVYLSSVRSRARGWREVCRELLFVWSLIPPFTSNNPSLFATHPFACPRTYHTIYISTCGVTNL